LQTHREKYDLIVVGSGAAGMMAAITAAIDNRAVLVLEKLPKTGQKLKATGGGRCNLTNTLSNEDFMSSFGKNGRFMTPSLNLFDQHKLREFFKKLGVDSHVPDGFRVFPITHDANTILSALEDELKRVGVDIKCSQKVKKQEIVDNKVVGVKTQNSTFTAQTIILQLEDWVILH